MTQDEFEQILNDQLRRINAVLNVKRDEYATTDVLSNFRTSAAIRGCSMPEAVTGMMVKHTTSIYDMVATGNPYPVEVWDEKITDHLNYLILLKACLIEGAKPNTKDIPY